MILSHRMVLERRNARRWTHGPRLPRPQWHRAALVVAGVVLFVVAMLAFGRVFA